MFKRANVEISTTLSNFHLKNRLFHFCCQPRWHVLAIIIIIIVRSHHFSFSLFASSLSLLSIPQVVIVACCQFVSSSSSFSQQGGWDKGGGGGGGRWGKSVFCFLCWILDEVAYDRSYYWMPLFTRRRRRLFMRSCCCCCWMGKPTSASSVMMMASPPLQSAKAGGTMGKPDNNWSMESVCAGADITGITIRLDLALTWNQIALDLGKTCMNRGRDVVQICTLLYAVLHWHCEVPAEFCVSSTAYLMDASVTILNVLRWLNSEKKQSRR